ncbi:hypothetical protein PV08_10035 [Exophiala spinifera]|uniref:Uncharacterized protein n=1 Tax=Exophiala spinifera TaxID=91928 RepID=A0A0D1Y754_9EURO|nr:uncharacterized protein PV08_10035 [Exophiala spinifera]KIW10736.1 hypothetical protein PV08_10035 [Exophiala spinifera]
MASETASQSSNHSSSYSKYQIQQYLDLIKFPLDHDHLSGSLLEVPPEQQYDFLARLIRRQICSVPFENIGLHYSRHREISLDPSQLFHKIVEQRRGGYCLEINTFMALVLRGLGFDVISVGGRVSNQIKPDNKNKQVEYGGWTHMVNIVTIEDQRYAVDCAFGNNGPTRPVPLRDGFTCRNTGDNTNNSEMLLRHESISESSSTPKQLLWTYYVRFKASMQWIPAYCFGEIEFLPNDFRAMNFYISKSPESWFTQILVCMKFLEDPNTTSSTADQVIIGDITLRGDTVKERKYGQSRIIATFHGEADRIAALQTYFGIELTAEERMGISGMISQLR